MADEKILPFDVVLTSLGREIAIDSTWNYITLALSVFKSSGASISVNSSDIGNFLMEFSEGAQFNEGVEFSGLRTFDNIFLTEFSGEIYLLSKVGFEDFLHFGSLNSSIQVSISNLQNFPLETIINDITSGINGDLSTIPANIKYYDDDGISEITAYNNFIFQDGISRFRVLPIFANALLVSQIDRLLNDLANSIFDPGGDLLIDLAGFNAVPSSASDAAIISLQGQGITVLVNSAFNNAEYYMKDNQHDFLNTANRFDFFTADLNRVDLTVNSGGSPIILTGTWFVEWVQDNVITDPVLFGTFNDFYQIKLVSGASAKISISANASAHTPVTFSYTCLENKRYRLESDGQGRFLLYENGVEVDNIVAGSNDFDRFECAFIGTYKIGPAFILSESKFSYCGFGQSKVLLHKYLFQEGSGLNLYDSIGGFHGLINGNENWFLGVDTPIAVGNQTSLNSWNNNAGVIIAENEANIGFDVLGNTILRPYYADGYNFSALLGHNYGGAGIFNRTGAGTDFYLVRAESLPTESFISGDDAYKNSVLANGKFRVIYNGLAIESVRTINPGQMVLFIFMTDGVGRGDIYISDINTKPEIDFSGTVGNSTIAAAPMLYGAAQSEAENFDGYIGKAAHFERELSINELNKVWYYYRRFFIN